MDDEQRFNQLHQWSTKKSEYVPDPDLNVIDVTPKPPKWVFKTQMPLGKRIDLFLISLVGLIIGLIALGVTCFLIYVMISALL